MKEMNRQYSLMVILMKITLEEMALKRRVYTSAKIGLDPSKNWSRPNNFCKEIVNFSWGHRRLWPHKNETIGAFTRQQELVRTRPSKTRSGPDIFCKETVNYSRTNFLTDPDQFLL